MIASMYIALGKFLGPSFISVTYGATNSAPFMAKINKFNDIKNFISKVGKKFLNGMAA